MTDRDRSSDSGMLGVLDVACGVLSDLDVDVVLERVLVAAREVTGAEYAALGVLDRSQSELERFITAGVDEPTRQRIGALPRGRGVLGELIEDPRPLRLADVGMHPHSYGFPAGHPPMKTFLGVPVRVAGQVFGNLYLTDKCEGKQFTPEDERALVRLAEFAGVAVDHARRYSGVDTQRSQLKETVQALDATVQIARAIGGETDLKKILELVAKRGRALVSARGLVIEHERGGEMVVAAGAGELVPGLIGKSVDAGDSLAGAALRTSSTLRLEDEPNRARFDRHGLGRLGLHASAGLVVPLIFRGQGHGVLIAVDRLKDGPAFTADDQRLLEAFAASAATAIATARSVELERASQRLAAAEQERARRDGLEVELRVELGDGRAGRHSTELETTVYRITQEALTNARKHGGAGHVLVEIQDYERYVHLVVRDDGRGFEPSAKADGFGLQIMGERAELLGGTLEIDSAPGRGTQITVDLPTDSVGSQRASYGDGTTAG